MNAHDQTQLQICKVQCSHMVHDYQRNMTVVHDF